MSGNFENTRDQLARAERQIREARERREREERNAARVQREKLERASPSGSRRHLIDILNGGNAPDIDVVTRLRALQKLTADNHNREHAKYLSKSADDGEPFDRLHPSRVRGQLTMHPSSVRAQQLARRSNFEIGADSPGMPEKTRYEWGERFDPPRAAEVMESRGSVDGDNRSGRHFADGEPELAVARWLLREAQRLIENAKRKEVGTGYPR